MDNNPLVTVNILSFNRRDELKNTLTKVYEQDYKNIEVIVVDNASNDGSPEMVEKEFPMVQLIKLKKNIGIAGWNEGFKVARGEYVLVLDDDSYPEEETIYNGVTFMNESINCGILAYDVFNLNNKFFETKGFSNDNPLTFIGCGALIRKKVFNKVSGFSELLFLYEHEVEFSMRVYNAGYQICFLKDSKIIHMASLKNRKINSGGTLIDVRRQYFVVRNILIILFVHFSLSKVVFRICRIIMGRLFFSMLDGYMITTIKGILAFLIQIPRLSFLREVLNLETQKHYKFGGFAGGFFFSENRFNSLKGKMISRR